MGIFSDDLRAVSRGGSAGEASDIERILPDRGLPPEVCDSTAERIASRSGSAKARAAARIPLWSSGAVDPDGGLGSSRVSMVGSTESPDAEVDAVDSQTFSDEFGNRASIAGDQRAADGSPSAGQEE